jgi:hypothetical protein
MTVNTAFDIQDVVDKAVVARSVPTYAVDENMKWAESRTTYNHDEAGLYPSVIEAQGLLEAVFDVG